MAQIDKISLRKEIRVEESNDGLAFILEVHK